MIRKNTPNEPYPSINKDKFSKEIENNNLLVSNDKYKKNFVDIEFNLQNNRHIGSVKTKYKTPGKATIPIIPPFNYGNNQRIKNDDILPIPNKNKNNNKSNIPKYNNNIPTSINSLKNNKQKNNISKKQNISNSLLNNNNIKENKIEEPFNSNISIISSSTNKNTNVPKDRIKIMINKFENIYKEALNNSNKIKT